MSLDNGLQGEKIARDLSVRVQLGLYTAARRMESTSYALGMVVSMATGVALGHRIYYEDSPHGLTAVAGVGTMTALWLFNHYFKYKKESSREFLGRLGVHVDEHRNNL
jgi:hypothetical protein